MDFQYSLRATFRRSAEINTCPNGHVNVQMCVCEEEVCTVAVDDLLLLLLYG